VQSSKKGENFIALNACIRKEKRYKLIISVSTLGKQKKRSKLNPK
jgi:hypothetical protein